MNWIPQLEERYYFPDISEDNKYCARTWQDSECDKHTLSTVGIYKTPEEAKLVGKSVKRFLKLLGLEPITTFRIVGNDNKFSIGLNGMAYYLEDYDKDTEWRHDPSIIPMLISGEYSVEL